MAERANSRELSQRNPHMPPTPFHDMERVFEDFFRQPFSLMHHPWSRSLGWESATPKVDVYEEENNVIIKAEIPGMSKENIELSVKENVLTISGEKTKEEKVEDKNYYQMERSYGSFSKSVILPVEVKSEEATATFTDGVLEIRMPKTEESQNRKKIEIQ